MCGVLLVCGIQLVPYAPVPDGTPMRTVSKVEALSGKSYSELTPLETVPVYCSDFVRKYSWNQTVAYNVMMIESKNYAHNLNDNPYTGDYSVGCFQINLLGANQTAKYRLAVQLGYTGANTREGLREWLWQPGNNVAVAYLMWQGQGWTPWSATTCKKIACY